MRWSTSAAAFVLIAWVFHPGAARGAEEQVPPEAERAIAPEWPYPPYGFEEPDDGPPAPPPEFLPLPAKVVQVQFCVVDDGRMFGVPASKAADSNPGKPDGRFPINLFGLRFDLELLIGLLTKNTLYANTGIAFALAGPTLYIEDPHPNTGPAFQHGGELGDVADPGGNDLRAFSDLSLASLSPALDGEDDKDDKKPAKPNPDGAGQLAKIRENCLRKAEKQPGGLSAGTILEVVIRRFVAARDDDHDGRIDEDTVEMDSVGVADKDGDGDDGEDGVVVTRLLGKALTPKCSQEPAALNPAPVVIDPHLLGFPNFGSVLAHENGHALCLRDAQGPPLRVMTGVVPPFGQGFTQGEIQDLQAQVKHLPGTRCKDSDGGLIEVEGPVTRYSLDEVLDVEAREVDLFGIGASRKADGSLGLLVQLARAVPPGVEATYTMAVDLDAATSTGLDYSMVGNSDLAGTDLVATVSVRGGPSDQGGGITAAKVLVESAGRWKELPQGATKFRFAPIAATGSSGSPFAVADTIFVVVPPKALPMQLAEGFRVLAVAQGKGGVYDTVPELVGSITPDWSGPHLSVEPSSAVVGDVVMARGTGFRPGASVELWAGATRAGAAVADELGAFSARVAVPLPGLGVSSPLARNRGVVPLSAVELGGRSDVAFLTVSLNRADR